MRFSLSSAHAFPRAAFLRQAESQDRQYESYYNYHYHFDLIAVNDTTPSLEVTRTFIIYLRLEGRQTFGPARTVLRAAYWLLLYLTNIKIYHLPTYGLTLDSISCGINVKHHHCHTHSKDRRRSNGTDSKECRDG